MKKLLAIFLSLAMVLSLSACSSSKKSTGSTDSGDPVKLVVAFRTFGTAPADLEKVQDAINEITRSKINAEVQLLCIASGSYKQQMTLMLSGSEQLDCMGATSAIYTSAYNSGELQPLDDLLQQYGQGILQNVDSQYLKIGQFDGKQYAVTTNRDQARGYGGFLLRTDILKKYNIDVSNVKTYDDLTKVFATVHEKEPNISVVGNGTVGYSFLQFCQTFDSLGDYFGVLLNQGQNLKVENLFTSDEYKNYLSVVRNWYTSGYISKDIVSATEAGASLVKAGTLFAYPNSGKPGIEQQESATAGTNMTYVQVLPTFTSTAAPLTWQWTIPQNSANPEKAMQFLNLMYTDSDIMNLLAYGIKGTHYVDNGDGTITYPSGVDAKTSGYSLNMSWQFGNEFIANVWKGSDPKIWDQTKEWNKTGVTSKAMGFVFDSSKVATEEAAVQNVYKQYSMSLECGVVDYNTVLPTMVQKMNDAGLQKIITEKQKQLDAWAQQNGVS